MVIESHFLSLEFAGELKEPDDGELQEKFPNYVRTIGEHWDSECVGGKFGQSGVYDSTQVFFERLSDPRLESKR